jgi:hypothetical protein
MRTESKVIGGVEYRVTQLGAIMGRAVFLRLVKAIGPVLASLASKEGTLSALVKGGGKVDTTVDFGEILSHLNLSEDDAKYLCDAFAEKTFVVEAPDKMPKLSNVFDEHFAGRYAAMGQWIAFCVKLNYADFFSDSLAEAIKQASANVPTATAQN